MQALLQQHLGLEATARLKTVNTIIEKLRREKTRLAEMQDIGGVRVVEDLTLSAQDELVAAVLALYPSAKVPSQRAAWYPRSGAVPLRQYLIVYRRSTGELIKLEDLGTDQTRALRHRFDLEQREKDDPDVEVVVLSAPSRKALERTHGRYFRTSRELTEDLRTALAK